MILVLAIQAVRLESQVASPRSQRAERLFSESPSVWFEEYGFTSARVSPDGHAQPTLTCTVLRACVIELEPGERVLSRISGDTERWEISPAPAGPDGRTVLIVVKPHECHITGPISGSSFAHS